MIKKTLILLAAILTLGTATMQADGTRKAKPVVSILGDSYSTFKGYVPEGNAIWYDTAPKKDRTDVADVRQTWWWQLISEGGYILGVNDSYSGATVSYSGYRGDDYADRSFITRLPRLGSPDIILIFGGTNDDWAGGPLGEFTYNNLRRGHFYEFRPAFAYLLKEAQNRYPGTEIYVIINDCLKESVTSSMKTICEHYKVPYIQLEGISKQANHPNIEGMKSIKDQVLKVLNK